MKTVVFYYTQSGQTLRVAERIVEPLSAAGNTEHQVVYKEIVPVEKYPFPWDKYIFYDTFPETRLGLPPSGIEPIVFSNIEDADVVIIVGQSWFLSPSLPLQSFFTDAQVKAYLKGRPVVFVNACRNMWLMTSRKIKTYLADAGARFVGHIVLQDETPNLISVVTIIRWLVYGKKEATRLLPSAGIAETDIHNASRFGAIIRDTFFEGDLSSLQERLLEAGAIHYKPSVLYVEKVGHRMFGLWAKFIRKKGGFRDPRRRRRVRLFDIYLMTVLFVVSPFGVLFFYLTYPLHHVARNKEVDVRVASNRQS